MCINTVVKCCESIFTGFLKLLQYIFFWANLLLWLIGLGFLIVDLYLIINRFVGIGEFDFVSELADYLNIDASELKIILLIASVLIGLFEMFAFTGCKSAGVNLNCLCCKTGKKSTCGLALYGTFTLICGIGLIVGSGLIKKYDPVSLLDGQLENLVIPNLDSGETFTSAVIQFQDKRSCCGVKFNSTVENMYTCGQWQDNIPFGCDCTPTADNSDTCILKSQATELYACQFGPSNTDYINGTDYIYIDGCGEVMTASLKEYVDIFQIMAVIVGVSMLIGGIIAIFLCCGLKSEQEQNPKSDLQPAHNIAFVDVRDPNTGKVQRLYKVQ